jgi:predicted ferric reductase
MYLAIPELSCLQWHPFSLSSSPNQKVVTLHIRKMGN